MEIGPTFAITLRLRHDIEAKARLQPSPLTWLQQRVSRELKKALGRPVPCYLALEEDERKALHLHGAFALLPEETETTPRLLARKLVLIRRALRRAGGEWETTRQHQCNLSAGPDEGWAGYVAKDFWKASTGMRMLLAPAKGWLRVTFDGQVLSVTADLRARAELAYIGDRWRLMRAFGTKSWKSV